jgi:hypothetical protein
VSPPEVLPPPPGTFTIELRFTPDDDPEITCIVCGRDKCDLSATVRDRRGCRVTMGKHTGCTWVMVK